MLIMFRVKNFASFKDEVVLDMRAVSYKDMQHHVIEEEKNKAIKTLAIYGKNASGKSNLISAMYYFESFVFNQFFDAGKREDEAIDEDRMINVKRNTFKLSNLINDSSEFEIIFTHNKKTFQYGFVIRDTPKTKKYIIEEEWLFVDNKKVFERKKNKIIRGKKYETELKGIDKYREDRLYVGVLDYFSQGNVKVIVDEFKDYLKNNFNVHFELILEGSVKGFIAGFGFCQRLIDDEKYRKMIEKAIKIADIGIVEISIEENNDEKTKDKKPYYIKTIHDVYDDKGNVVGQEKFDLSMESSGTIRYFSFIQYILNIIENEGVFVVDEISARLHPILTKFIIDLFQDERNKGAQLIFTTHDISLMNRKQFRRDEIAFIEKDYMGKSSMYTLADIKIRSDASFSKDYLAGKYGAIPILSEKAFEEMVGE